MLILFSALPLSGVFAKISIYAMPKNPVRKTNERERKAARPILHSDTDDDLEEIFRSPDKLVHDPASRSQAVLPSPLKRT